MEIYFINLAHRTDRLVEIQSELAKYGLVGTRIDAVKPEISSDRLLNAYAGCCMSHIKALESSTGDCMILEDDFEFVCDPSSISNTFTDWDVLMLAANVLESSPGPPGFRRCTKAYTTAGYIVRKEYVKTLIDNFREGLDVFIQNGGSMDYALDVWWFKLQNKDRWYVVDPKIGKQRASFSDIQNGFRDYGV